MYVFTNLGVLLLSLESEIPKGAHHPAVMSFLHLKITSFSKLMIIYSGLINKLSKVLRQNV